MLARFAALHFDRMDRARIVGYLNMRKSLPCSEAVKELGVKRPRGKLVQIIFV